MSTAAMGRRQRQRLGQPCLAAAQYCSMQLAIRLSAEPAQRGVVGGKSSREAAQGRTQRQREGVAQRGQQAHEDRQLLRTSQQQCLSNFTVDQNLCLSTCRLSSMSTSAQTTAWLSSARLRAQ